MSHSPDIHILLGFNLQAEFRDSLSSVIHLQALLVQGLVTEAGSNESKAASNQAIIYSLYIQCKGKGKSNEGLHTHIFSFLTLNFISFY